jgi:hypothetical protein
VSLLPIPQPVDDALGALARRRNLPKEIASLLFSVGRHVIRVFGGGGASQEDGTLSDEANPPSAACL